jgi:tetrahydromethanopterin S-methyltransferase subunit F
MAGRPTGTEARPTEELAQLREENLRLRDQLIARDAEAGLLRGQVAELEAGAARAMHLLQRIKGLVPGVVWKIISRVARLLKRG